MGAFVRAAILRTAIDEALRERLRSLSAGLGGGVVSSAPVKRPQNEVFERPLESEDRRQPLPVSNKKRGHSLSESF
jgi:hypothetical protein